MTPLVLDAGEPGEGPWLTGGEATFSADPRETSSVVNVPGSWMLRIHS